MSRPARDPLTGLPDRALFLDRLDQAILRARRRHTEACAAVLVLGLDRFTLVNDTLGHAAGDRLLAAVAQRLQTTLRPTDTVARLAGDAFVLLLTDVTDAREAQAVADRIQQALAAPFTVHGRTLFVGASAGIALARPDARPEDVVRDADVAMHRAKSNPNGDHAVFEAAMRADSVRRLELESELRQAIDARALQVAYQPIVQAATGRIAGFEALCRWPDEKNGFHATQDFLPIAEETGLIVPLGAWALRTACEQLAAWRRTRAGARLTVSVNVSRRQLTDKSFPATLTHAIEGGGLDPAALRLEVPERALAQDDTERLLAGIRNTHGVRSHVDEFGTGASSLHLLHRFPGDAVKIDRSLVIGMARDAAAFDIVKALVSLAHNLGLEAIAEGVESREQLDHLKVLGCEFAQGFHIAAPLAPSGAAALLRERVSLAR